MYVLHFVLWKKNYIKWSLKSKEDFVQDYCNKSQDYCNREKKLNLTNSTETKGRRVFKHRVS